jgi:PEP-CTERM motif
MDKVEIMKNRLVLPLATAILLVGARCAGGTLTVTDGGTWAGDAPTSTESVPGELWSVSFQVQSNPIPLNFTTGVQTVLAVTNLVFDLNGTPVQTQASGGSVEFFTGEGFRLFLPDGDDLQIQDTTQLYSGSEAAPTVLPGSYPPGFTNNAFLFVNSTSSFYNFTSNNIVIADATLPEPSSFLLFGAGLAVLVGVAARRIV